MERGNRGVRFRLVPLELQVGRAASERRTVHRIVRSETGLRVNSVYVNTPAAESKTGKENAPSSRRTR